MRIVMMLRALFWVNSLSALFISATYCSRERGHPEEFFLSYFQEVLEIGCIGSNKNSDGQADVHTLC